MMRIFANIYTTASIFFACLLALPTVTVRADDSPTDMLRQFNGDLKLDESGRYKVDKERLFNFDSNCFESLKHPGRKSCALPHKTWTCPKRGCFFGFVGTSFDNFSWIEWSPHAKSYSLIILGPSTDVYRLSIKEISKYIGHLTNESIDLKWISPKRLQIWPGVMVDLRNGKKEIVDTRKKQSAPFDQFWSILEKIGPITKIDSKSVQLASSRERGLCVGKNHSMSCYHLPDFEMYDDPLYKRMRRVKYVFASNATCHDRNDRMEDYTQCQRFSVSITPDGYAKLGRPVRPWNDGRKRSSDHNMATCYIGLHAPYQSSPGKRSVYGDDRLGNIGRKDKQRFGDADRISFGKMTLYQSKSLCEREEAKSLAKRQKYVDENNKRDQDSKRKSERIKTWQTKIQATSYQLSRSNPKLEAPWAGPILMHDMQTTEMWKQFKAENENLSFASDHTWIRQLRTIEPRDSAAGSRLIGSYLLHTGNRASVSTAQKRAFLHRFADQDEQKHVGIVPAPPSPSMSIKMNNRQKYYNAVMFGNQRPTQLDLYLRSTQAIGSQVLYDRFWYERGVSSFKDGYATIPASHTGIGYHKSLPNPDDDPSARFAMARFVSNAASHPMAVWLDVDMNLMTSTRNAPGKWSAPHQIAASLYKKSDIDMFPAPLIETTSNGDLWAHWIENKDTRRGHASILRIKQYDNAKQCWNKTVELYASASDGNTKEPTQRILDSAAASIDERPLVAWSVGDVDRKDPKKKTTGYAIYTSEATPSGNWGPTEFVDRIVASNKSFRRGWVGVSDRIDWIDIFGDERGKHTLHVEMLTVTDEKEETTQRHLISYQRDPKRPGWSSGIQGPPSCERKHIVVDRMGNLMCSSQIGNTKVTEAKIRQIERKIDTRRKLPKSKQGRSRSHYQAMKKNTWHYFDAVKQKWYAVVPKEPAGVLRYRSSQREVTTLGIEVLPLDDGDFVMVWQRENLEIMLAKFDHKTHKWGGARALSLQPSISNDRSASVKLANGMTVKKDIASDFRALITEKRTLVVFWDQQLSVSPATWMGSKPAENTYVPQVYDQLIWAAHINVDKI